LFNVVSTNNLIIAQGLVSAIQHGCLQRLQPEVNEEDWDHNIPI